MERQLSSCRSLTECVTWKNCKAGELCSTRPWSYEWERLSEGRQPKGLCVDSSLVSIYGYPPYNYEDPEYFF